MTNKLEINFKITEEEILTESNLHTGLDMILYAIGHNLLSFYAFLNMASEEDKNTVADIVTNTLSKNKKGLN